MNKDTNKIFKGILQYTSEQFDGIEKQPGFIYFVRKSDDKNNGDAEIWFGNRRYGSVNVSDLELRNIGASDVDNDEIIDNISESPFVKFVEQVLTEAQQEQVRKNINAMKLGNISCGTF